MQRTMFILTVLAGIAMFGSANALESGATCDIEDDAVQQVAMDELKEILKQLSKPGV